MDIVIVAADCEENLGAGMVAAVLVQRGHRVRVEAFNHGDELDVVEHRVLAHRPELVALAIQSQYRSPDFLDLAHRLRARGFAGHITCGGQHATLAAEDLIRHEAALDSVVVHEGEFTTAELVEGLTTNRDLNGIRGLVLRRDDGTSVRTLPRGLCQDLESLPWTYRYRKPDRYLGLPFLPVWGSRGCWGACTFCAISSYYRQARDLTPGKSLRFRAVDDLAAEMASLAHEHGQPSVFCFHDDTLLLPRPRDTLARLTALRNALAARGVDDIGMIGKCRPDCVTPELAKALRRLGIVRMFVGVENASAAGQLHLNRRTEREELETAVRAFSEAGVLVCYNLLLFEPDMRLEDLVDNIAFIRLFPSVPFNFCRAEPYQGTPLHRALARRGSLLGDHRGWDYRIKDDRSELLFRIVTTAMYDRAYGGDGLANRSAAVAHAAQLLRCFYDAESAGAHRILDAADDVVCGVARDTADLLEEALEFVQHVDLQARASIERFAAELTTRAATHDRGWHRRADSAMLDLTRLSRASAQSLRIGAPRRHHAPIRQAALAGVLATALPACGGQSDDGDETLGPSGMAGASSGGAFHSSGASSATGGVWGDPASPPLLSGGTSGTGGHVSSDGGAPPRSGGGTSGTGGHVSSDGGAPPRSGGGTSGTGGYISSDGGAPPRSGGGTSGTGGYITGDGGAPPRSGGGTSGTGGYNTGDGGAPPVSGGWGGIGAADGGSPPLSGGGSSGANAIIGIGALPPVVGTGVGDRQTPTAPALKQRGQDRDGGDRSRSPDLPLYGMPRFDLSVERGQQNLVVRVTSNEPNLELCVDTDGDCWEQNGVLHWSPRDAGDRLTVIARSPAGIAVRTVLAPQSPV